LDQEVSYLFVLLYPFISLHSIFATNHLQKDVYKGYIQDDGTPGESVLQHLGNNGLINFTDYLFLLTVLGSKYETQWDLPFSSPLKICL
jgi:hypothetical protein